MCHYLGSKLQKPFASSKEVSHRRISSLHITTTFKFKGHLHLPLHSGPAPTIHLTAIALTGAADPLLSISDISNRHNIIVTKNRVFITQTFKIQPKAIVGTGSKFGRVYKTALQINETTKPHVVSALATKIH